MSDEAEREYRSEQISRTFALLTAKLEDAVALAVDGQAPRADTQIRDLALQIAELAGCQGTRVPLTVPRGRSRELSPALPGQLEAQSGG